MKYLILSIVLLCTFYVECFILKHQTNILHDIKVFSTLSVFSIFYFWSILFLTNTIRWTHINQDVSINNIFLSSIYNSYSKFRKHHTSNNSLSITNIIRRALGEIDFTDTYNSDVYLLKELDKIVHYNIKEYHITTNNIKQLVLFIKFRRSVIGDRNNFLVVFTVMVTMYFALKELPFMADIINQIFLKTWIFSLGFITILERVTISKSITIYDEVLLSLENMIKPSKKIYLRYRVSNHDG